MVSMLRIFNQSLLFAIFFITFLTANLGAQDTEEFFSRPAPNYPSHDPLLGWIDSRNSLTLNGKWHYIVDPMNNGLPEESFFGGFPANKTQKNNLERVEFSFEDAETMNVPGDWNSQNENLFFYRGPVWFYKKFNYSLQPNELVHLYIGTSNFSTKIFINGEIVGAFNSGYTAFNFEVSKYLKNGDNFIIIQVDNTLSADTVPTKKTDWWPYGGILGDVQLISTPRTFIQNANLQLSDISSNEIKLSVHLNEPVSKKVNLSIPELGIDLDFVSDPEGSINQKISSDDLILWDVGSPKLYDVVISTDSDVISDRIGFREIKVIDEKILLNGNQIKLKGISMHAEPIGEEGFAFSKQHFKNLLNTAQDLKVNFIRASHYPYTRYISQLCDELGILLWEEIPVYWNINWSNAETKTSAKTMLTQMIHRDWNRASVIIWSIGNETPFSDARMDFMIDLKETAEGLDSSRLISAALLSGSVEQFRSLTYFLAKEGLKHSFVSDYEKAIFKQIVSQLQPLYGSMDTFKINIKDPLAEHLDIIAYNEYFGWYYTSFIVDQLGVEESTLRKLMFKLMPSIKIESQYKKPIHLSEFGAGAKRNFKADGGIWSEEYQEDVYRHQLEMIQNNDQIQGLSPWILKDFRSMMRPLAGVQDFYNRKGLVDEDGKKKKAFKVLQQFYQDEWE